jgi:hypothetical protein
VDKVERMSKEEEMAAAIEVEEMSELEEEEVNSDVSDIDIEIGEKELADVNSLYIQPGGLVAVQGL